MPVDLQNPFRTWSCSVQHCVCVALHVDVLAGYRPLEQNLKLATHFIMPAGPLLSFMGCMNPIKEHIGCTFPKIGSLFEAMHSCTWRIICLQQVSVKNTFANSCNLLLNAGRLLFSLCNSVKHCFSLGNAGSTAAPASGSSHSSDSSGSYRITPPLPKSDRDSSAKL